MVWLKFRALNVCPHRSSADSSNSQATTAENGAAWHKLCLISHQEITSTVQVICQKLPVLLAGGTTALGHTQRECKTRVKTNVKKKKNHKNYNSRPLMEMPPCFTERESIIPEIPANKPGPNTRRGAELHTLRPVLRVGIFSSSGRAKRDEAPRQVSSEFCKRALKIH